MTSHDDKRHERPATRMRRDDDLYRTNPKLYEWMCELDPENLGLNGTDLPALVEYAKQLERAASTLSNARDFALLAEEPRVGTIAYGASCDQVGGESSCDAIPSAPSHALQNRPERPSTEALPPLGAPTWLPVRKQSLEWLARQDRNEVDRAYVAMEAIAMAQLALAERPEGYAPSTTGEIPADWHEDMRAAWEREKLRARQLERELADANSAAAHYVRDEPDITPRRALVRQAAEIERLKGELAQERANRDTAARVECEMANELLKAMGGDPAYSLLENAKRLSALSAIRRSEPHHESAAHWKDNHDSQVRLKQEAQERLRQVLAYIEALFVSGNDVPVERAWINDDAWVIIKECLSDRTPLVHYVIEAEVIWRRSKDRIEATGEAIRKESPLERLRRSDGGKETK